MSLRSYKYVILDVFTAKRLTGNQLAIVHVGAEDIPDDEKLLVTKEFNLSETVFLHDIIPGRRQRIQIFTLTGELEFAGHPVIGTGSYIFQHLATKSADSEQAITVIAKAGPVALTYDAENQVVRADIPHNVRVHSEKISKDRVLATQPTLLDTKDVLDTFPVVSIVKGMTFALVNFTNVPDLLAELKAAESPPLDYDAGWEASFGGVLYYRRLADDSSHGGESYRTRMIATGLEDPATGSACSALASYLSLQKAEESAKYSYRFEQGVEMGRTSLILVDVELNGTGDGVAVVSLSGQAVLVMEGTLHLG